MYIISQGSISHMDIGMYEYETNIHNCDPHRKNMAGRT
jgi:hypothetical protein